MNKLWNRLTDYILEAVLHKRTGAGNQEDKRDYKLDDHVRIAAPKSGFVNLLNINDQNQGRTNRCTAYSCAHACSIMMTLAKKKECTFEAEDIWNWQLEQGTADEARGDFINSAPKAVCKYSIMDLMGHIFPYGKYAMVQEDEFKKVLESGRPIMTGTRISYPMVDKDYNIKSGGNGGHAFLIVGYDDDAKRYLCLNSWAYWGINNTGMFYVPYDKAGMLFRSYVFV